VSSEGGEPHGENLDRVSRWLDESREIIGRVIPEIVEDRVRQRDRVEAAEDTCHQLRQETTSLRHELTELQSDARALRRQLVEIGESARTAVAQLSGAVLALEEMRRRRAEPPPAAVVPTPPARRSRWWRVALVAAGGSTALVLGLALAIHFTPIPSPPPPRVAPPLPAPIPAGTEEQPAPEAPAPAKVARVPVPENPPVRLRNEIRHFRAVNVSGHEIEVVVDYAYAGDHGRSDIFIHAAALEQGEELRSRVPGTSFPFAAIGVGDGSVSIRITKQPDTGASVSTRVKVCMVSIKSRSAFVCQVFPYLKAWDS
jgi:hypothetical protein